MSEVREARCPYCLQALTVAQVFDNCVVSWPNQSWLRFKCPACEKWSHIHAVDDGIAFGELDGVPGPRFIPKLRVDKTGLRVSTAVEGITLLLDDRSWFIPSNS